MNALPKVCAAAFLTLAMGGAARAETITFDITASGFQYLLGPTGGAPVDPVTEDITVTFDPSTTVEPTNSGLTITNFNLPYASKFSYVVGGDITVGSDTSLGGFQDVAASYALFIDDPLTNAPQVYFVQTALSGESWSVANASVTSSVSGAPEPSTWALLLIGLAGLGIAGYRRSLSKTLARSMAA